MRVPFKRSKSYKSDVQTEIGQSPKAPISPTHPKDQLDNSRRRRLSKRHHSSASVPTIERPLNTPVTDARPDEPPTRRQLVSRVAVQWRKTTQKKMGLNKKTAPQSKRNSQYEAVLDASDSEGELDMTQPVPEAAHNQFGGETTRPRDSAVPSEINLKPEQDVHDQLDPVMAPGEVSNAEPSTAKESDVNITVITGNGQSNNNNNDDNDDDLIRFADSSSSPIVDAQTESEQGNEQADSVDVLQDIDNQDDLPGPTASASQPRSKILSKDIFTHDADFMPPSRTPSPLTFCKRSLPRSRNLNFPHSIDSAQAYDPSDSYFPEVAIQQGAAEAETPCPTRVSLLPSVSSGEEAASVDEVNTEEEGVDGVDVYEAIAPRGTIHAEAEECQEVGGEPTSPDMATDGADTTSETTAKNAEADGYDYKSVIVSPEIAMDEAETTNEVNLVATEADERDARSMNFSPQSEAAETETHMKTADEDKDHFSPDTNNSPKIDHVESDTNIQDTNENDDNQHGPEEIMPSDVANTEAEVNVQTADNDNETHDEQETIDIQVFEIGTQDGDDDGNERSQTETPEQIVEQVAACSEPEMIVEDDESRDVPEEEEAAAYSEPEIILERNESQQGAEETIPPHEAADIETDNTPMNIESNHQIEHKPLPTAASTETSTLPLDIPNTPNPRHFLHPTILQDTQAYEPLPTSTGNSPVSTFSASGSFPPNSFPPLSTSFPEDLPRSTPPEEESPQVTPSDTMIGLDEECMGPINTENMPTSSDEPQYGHGSPNTTLHLPHNSIRRRRPTTKDNSAEETRDEESGNDGEQTIHEHYTSTSTTLPNPADKKAQQKAKETWKQWTLKWITGCTGRRNLIRWHLFCAEVETMVLLRGTEVRGLEVEMDVLRPMVRRGQLGQVGWCVAGAGALRD